MHQLARHPGLKPSRLLAMLVLAWVTFGWLAWGVARPGSLGFDEPLLNFWHRHATPGLNKLAVGLTVVGNTWPMIGTSLLALLMLLRRRKGRLAGLFALSVGGSMLLTQVIKYAVERARPALWASLRPEHTYSFPSGHAMDTAAIATALGLLLWEHRAHWLLWLPAPLFSLAVGWARMYLGVHYPSDVLAGWAGAVGWVVLVQLLAQLGHLGPDK